MNEKLELIDRLSNVRFIGSIILIMWVLTPGYAAILYYRPDMFSAYDPIKLTILASMYAGVFIAPVGFVFYRVERLVTEQTMRLAHPSLVTRLEEQFRLANLVRAVLIATSCNVIFFSVIACVQFVYHYQTLASFLLAMAAGVLIVCGSGILLYVGFSLLDKVSSKQGSTIRESR